MLVNEAKVPTYNHTRGDSARTPCALCRALRRVGELEKAALAYRDLSTCYRLGKRPSENLFARLDRARKALEKGVT